MTIQEASERYQIPMHILREYESWGLCGAVKKVMGNWQYDDTDPVLLRTRWRSICGFCWKASHPVHSGFTCWRKSAAPLWMRSTSKSINFNGWITCAMRSEKHSEEQEAL